MRGTNRPDALANRSAAAEHRLIVASQGLIKAYNPGDQGTYHVYLIYMIYVDLGAGERTELGGTGERAICMWRSRF